MLQRLQSLPQQLHHLQLMHCRTTLRELVEPVDEEDWRLYLRTYQLDENNMESLQAHLQQLHLLLAISRKHLLLPRRRPRRTMA